MEKSLKAYVTNLGKYNEGELVGEWVDFPITQEEEEELMERIGIGEEDEFGQPYEEYFISDYEIYDLDFFKMYGEYVNIDTLNDVAEMIQRMNDNTFALLCAVVEDGGISDVREFNEEDYVWWKGKDKVDVAECEVDEIYYRLPDAIKNCIDYEKYADWYMDDYVETKWGTFCRC